MTRVTLVALAAIAFSSVSFGQQNRDSFESQYGVLTDRNPFMRERRRPQPPRDRSRDSQNAANAQRNRRTTFVLRGVTIEDAQLHAYLENSRGGDIVRVSPGDTLGDGRVVDIDISAIAFESNGRVQWVEVGQDLTGSRNTETSSSNPATTGPSTQSTGAASPPLPPGGGTLEERLRARRAQMRGNR